MQISTYARIIAGALRARLQAILDEPRTRKQRQRAQSRAAKAAAKRAERERLNAERRRLHPEEYALSLEQVKHMDERDDDTIGNDGTIGGQIDRWISEKGYGFVWGDDGRNYFMHVTQIQNREICPIAGMRCSFLAVTTPRGPAAQYVILDPGC